MILVDGLHKHFRLSRRQAAANRRSDGRTFKAIDGVSFVCEPGRIFCLLGPNGAGKTTTLRVIATMLHPTRGRVEVAGHDVEEEPIKVRRKLGFLTNATALYDRLTPREFLRYCARLHGVSRHDYQRRMEELIELLEMSEFADRRIGTFSTGMKQRVSVARTMIHDPDVVVFDEATSGLDVIAAQHISDLVRHCRNAGKTVIFSTHRMEEVNALADDLAVMHRGRLLINTSLPELRRSMREDTLEAEFARMVREADRARAAEEQELKASGEATNL